MVIKCVGIAALPTHLITRRKGPGYQATSGEGRRVMQMYMFVDNTWQFPP